MITLVLLYIAISLLVPLAIGLVIGIFYIGYALMIALMIALGVLLLLLLLGPYWAGAVAIAFLVSWLVVLRRPEAPRRAKDFIGRVLRDYLRGIHRKLSHSRKGTRV